MRDKQGLVLGAMAAMNLILVIAFAYAFFSTNNTLTDRVARLESSAGHQEQQQESSKEQAAKNEKEMADIMADLGVIKDKIGVTSTELKRARDTAQSLKKKQEETEKELASQLAAKANSADVDGLRETATKLAAGQQDSNNKLGSVSGELAGLKQELATTREDWGRQLVDVKNVLSEGIARNSNELAELKKKGDRDYFEFDIRKNSKPPFQRVAGLQLALLKTDPGKHKFSVVVQVDDYRLEKKDRTANEPMQFLVGREQLRYEVVVNSVDKDRIRGYISAPKDKVLSAEIPQFRK